MIAALVNYAHVGRKLKISSLDGLILGVKHRRRGRSVDIVFELETTLGAKTVVVSPRTEVTLLEPVLPREWRD
ncbi:hypothetical protein BJD55_gp082 [Gordonia phage Yvonnetastic]|uniref:Uncharacterized protein n=1 Tax=Gordonia phage Yvonnetastic TaxID=1821566 RepID=A0A142K9A1_9CAUD|nr:hypothetical protein BJD55_gp082 [Gordonia phage Yvonnetastic]AMS02684.1 hypothetical protein SEA_YVONNETASTIC_140 [Gordonia phage Yvonnetastic]WKW86117.1 hypothetical protein SEA_JONJAMES_143 [Gordonia Phage JonJames]